MSSVSVFRCVCDCGQLVYIFHQKRSNILLSTPAAARVCLLSRSLSLSSILSELTFSGSLTMSPCLHPYLTFSLYSFLHYQSFFPFLSLSSLILCLNPSYPPPPPPFFLHHNLSLPTVSPLTPSLNLSLSPLSLLISPRPIPLLSLSLSGVNVGVIEECWMCAVTGLISCSDAWSARSSL